MASPEGTELQTFPDGTNKHEINWHNGKKEGWEIKWYSNGQMLSKRKWVAGNPKPPGMIWDEKLKILEFWIFLISVPKIS